MRGARMRGMGAWVVVATGALVLCVSAFGIVVPRPALPIHVAVTGSRSPVPSYPAESLGSVTVRRDLFRTDRHPAAVPYDPTRGAAPPPDGPPKPQLTLTGVVWGDAPEAVIEGLPTAPGPRVVRVGDVVGGVTIKRIEVGLVIAAGFDTTWTLTVREPWK